MTTLQISRSSLPSSLAGKVAVITGGASGIGYATATILTQHGCSKVYLLDTHPPPASSFQLNLVYKKCDVTVWKELSSSFLSIGHIDMVFANAGILEREPFLTDEDENGEGGKPLLEEAEPTYPVLDVVLKSTLNVVRLSWGVMRKQEEGGSIVLTASSTAYAPEIGMPVFCAVKAALIGLVRSLRPILPASNITINAVAPGATDTPLIPRQLFDPIIAAGLPVSSAEAVGLALVYSATAQESYRTDVYGKEEKEGDKRRVRRWNGKVIMTLGDQYTEVEGPLNELRPMWLGEENDKLIKAQQAVTDFRAQN